MRDTLRPLLGHPVTKIRHLAAESCIAFLPHGEVEQIAATGPRGECLLGVEPAGSRGGQRGANAISGQLFTVETWLHSAPTHGEAVDRAR